MKSIKGLILKDLLNLNHYRVTLIIMIITLSFIAISQKNLSGTLPIMIIMMVGMIALSTFSYDEIAKTDRFISTLPTNKKEIVASKYILIISLTLIGAIFSIIIGYILSIIILKQTPDIMGIILTAIGGLFSIGLIHSIQIPSIYKWGFEKGRIQMFIIFALIIAVCGGIVMLTKNINFNFDMTVLKNIITVFGVPIMIILTAIMYFISYKISYKVYTKKEF